MRSDFSFCIDILNWNSTHIASPPLKPTPPSPTLSSNIRIRKQYFVSFDLQPHSTDILKTNHQYECVESKEKKQNDKFKRFFLSFSISYASSCSFEILISFIPCSWDEPATTLGRDVFHTTDYKLAKGTSKMKFCMTSNIVSRSFVYHDLFGEWKSNKISSTLGVELFQ